MRFVAVFLTLALTGPACAQGVLPMVNTEIAAASKDDAYLLQLYCLGQVPANHNEEPIKILINHGFAVGYSEIRRNPMWAVYKASGTAMGEPFRSERSDFFVRDLRTVSQVHGQTFGNDMDRGHMVPNAAIGNQYGSLAQMETFLMSNITPQHANLNRGPWQRLERFITHLAQDREHVFVFCGPIFGEEPAIVERAADREIQIPDAFFMILIDTEREFTLDFEEERIPTVRTLAYIFPQDTERGADFKDREKFGASIDQIEEQTGLDFFPGAEEFGGNRWRNIESEIVEEHWEIDFSDVDVTPSTEELPTHDVTQADPETDEGEEAQSTSVRRREAFLHLRVPSGAIVHVKEQGSDIVRRTLHGQLGNNRHIKLLTPVKTQTVFEVEVEVFNFDKACSADCKGCCDVESWKCCKRVILMPGDEIYMQFKPEELKCGCRGNTYEMFN